MKSATGVFGWGTATGPLHRQPPEVVLGCTALVFAALAIAPVATLPGLIFAMILLGLWVASAVPPGRQVLMVLAAGIVLFGPVFLLSPVIAAENLPQKTLLALPTPQSLLVTFNVFFKGIAGVLITTTAVASMTESGLYNAIHRMPLPHTLRAITAVIVVQTGALVRETHSIIRALTLRGATGGWRASWLAATSLPQVWLPRVIRRAERNAMAMEIRGFDGFLPPQPRNPANAASRLMVAGCGLAVAAAILLRLTVTG